MLNFILVYISIYLFLIFTNVCFRPINNFFIFGLFVFLVFFGFNNIEQLSLDYYNYLAIFQTVKSFSWVDLMVNGDPLFLLLVRILNLFVFDDIQIFLYLIFFSLILKFYISYKFISVKIIPIYLFLILGRFYFLHDLTQLRAGIAIALGSIALLFFYKNNFKFNSKIFLIYILSCLFHISLLVVLPLYFFMKSLIKIRKFYLIYFLIFICIAVGYLFSNFLSNIISSISFIDRIALYFSDQGEDQNVKYSVFQFYFIIKFSLLIYLSNVYFKLDNFHKALVLTYVYAMCLQALFVFSSAIGLRFAAIFGYIDMMVFLIPLSNYFYKKYFYLYFIFITLIGVVFFYSSLLTIGIE